MSIRELFENTVQQAAQQIRSLPWENRQFYENWLAQQFFLVQHTPRLLCAYALRVPLDNRSDFSEIMHHLKEENGHDLWLLNDLEKMGTSPKNFKPLPSSQALIKSQYYQIQHDDPTSLCGYSQFLEYLSAVVAGELSSRVEKSFGKNTAVFLKGHASVDVEHSEDGWKMLARLNPEQNAKVIENLNMTAKLYLRMFDEIAMAIPSQVRGKAS